METILQLATGSIVTLDLYKDWEKIVRSAMLEMSFDSPAGFSKQDIGLEYADLLNRMIAPRKRNVHLSDKLRSEEELPNEVQVLVSRIRRGEDLNVHLSRKILSPGYRDFLLNDWGIHHLHLGESLNPRRFVRRTSKLLFAYIEANDAYLIDVRAHGRQCKESPWADEKLIEIMVRNWPSLFTSFVVESRLECGAKTSSIRRKELRELGLNAPVEIDRRAYASTRGGLACSGDSLFVMMRICGFKRWLYGIQQRACKELVKRLHESRVVPIRLAPRLRCDLWSRDFRIDFHGFMADWDLGQLHWFPVLPL